MSSTFTIALSLSQPINPTDCPAHQEFQHWFAACYAQTQAIGLNTLPNQSFNQNQPSNHKHEISLRVCTPKEMAQLNHQYRNKPTTTNVLAFPAKHPTLTDNLCIPAEENITPLGDIVFCAHTIQQEAKEQHKQLKQHWAHISIHGLLHLKGFDHETTQDAEEMEALETQVLAALGFPNPYTHQDSQRLTEQAAEQPSS